MSAVGDTPLESLLRPRLIFTDLPGEGLEDVFAELARRLAEAGVVRDPEELTRRLLERESFGCTALGAGVAIPHLKLKGVSEVLVAIATFSKGVDFRAPDGTPVTLLFLVLSPADAPALHLQALARISRLLRTPGVADNLRKASDAREIIEAIKEAQTAPTAVRA